MMLSSMFLSPLLIKKFGCKWTMVGSMSCYLTFSLANFYANWYTLIPTSILLGLGAAPLWASQCTYITIVGNLQAKKEKKLGKDVVNQYFGVFFLVFQSSGVCGNLISSLVFSQTPTHVTIPDSQLQSCGAKDCLMATVASNNTSKPSKQLIYTLLSIFNGSSILAILLLIVFLESVEDRMENEREAGPRSPPLWSTLLATFMLFKNDKRLRLLILLPLYSGMNQGFMNGEYTKVPPHCALCCMGRSPSTRAGLHSSRWESIRKSGGSTWVQMVPNPGCVRPWPPEAEATPPTVLSCFLRPGAVIHFSCFITLLLWHPNPAHLPVFFIIPGLWGMADAVWQTQNNALYGVLFVRNKEAAFANYRLGESLGYVIAFGYSSFLCVSTKLGILLGVLTVTMMAYGIVEYLEPKTTNKSVATEEKSQAEKEEMKTEV
nr:protein unc-93 homolog A isoform X7 [Peromyscus maniculatus bairdii]XP_042118371.1 protein unc-93 homolog A isoform X7 [Peromyscus maniculatus bairdii]